MNKILSEHYLKKCLIFKEKNLFILFMPDVIAIEMSQAFNSDAFESLKNPSFKAVFTNVAFAHNAAK